MQEVHMRTTLIVGAVFALACVGVGIYFLISDNMTAFGVCIFAAVLCFWPSFKKWREIKNEENNDGKSDKDGGNAGGKK